MKKRRICILTQPLSVGYGGLLQAYALQTILKRMGHSVWTEDRRKNKSNWSKCLDFFKMIIICIFSPVLSYLTGVYYTTPWYTRKVTKNTDYFKFKYISTTVPISSNSKRKLKRYKFDTYIVGSDQVWRPRYSYGIDSLYNYFLDFTKNTNVKRIAYGASFGVSEWEFSKEQTVKCKSLIKSFDAVSVREDTGVDLCEKYFGVDAKQVLDPTLLLDREDYVALVENESTPHFKENLFVYFLDNTEEKKEIVKYVAENLDLQPFSIMPTELFYKVGPKYIDKCIFAPVTAWLRAYMDARFIITDSFHGTVFSIIFNKPFVVIANRERGLSRFTSILRIFGLGNRLIYSKSELSKKLIMEKINFERVNEIRELKRAESLQFLVESLI